MTNSGTPSRSILGPMQHHFETLFPGIGICLIVAAAAQFLSEHYGAPQMLFALLLGMAVHFLSEEGRCVAGVEFCAKKVLRIGVALLGLRITVDQVLDLGLEAVAWVASGVFLTILLGWAVVRLRGGDTKFGVLSGGAVGICGASAALAISSVLPSDKKLERNTIFAVISVTTLSTLAMIVYPIISDFVGLDRHQAGIFLGATIHDVAQVVGAGYGISESTGDTATIVKLFRVALLVPVVIAIGFLFRRQKGEGDQTGGKSSFPWFVLAFCVLVAINSTGIVTDEIRQPFSDLSRWMLVTAIAALGVKTSLKSLMQVGIAPVVLVFAETVFIAGWILIWLVFLQ